MFFLANNEPQHALLKLHRCICLFDFYQNKVVRNFPCSLKVRLLVHVT